MSGLRIIGHRGDRQDYPENTVPALQAAIAAGADGIELDVRFTADEVPVLFHDRSLRRMTGHRGLLAETTAATLAGLPAGEPARFGAERFRDVRVATLADAMQAVRGSDALVFVEIKADGIPRHRYPAAVESILRASAPLGERVVIISFEAELLRIARSSGAASIGWVIDGLDKHHLDYADTLSPSYLLIDRANVGDGTDLWHGDWSWLVYEVNDAAEARRLQQSGAWGVETASVQRLRTELENG